MIIPVAFEVSKEVNFEDFDVNAPVGSILAVPPPDFRVTVKLFDTETSRGFGFSARVLVDPEAEPYHGLMTLIEMHSAVDEDKQAYMRELRDHLNELLED